MATYKGRTVPPFSVKGKDKAIKILLERSKNRTFCMTAECISANCAVCLYRLSYEEVSLVEEITLDWYLENGYFTKTDILKAVFDSKNNT